MQGIQDISENMGTYGVETLNAWPRSLHTGAVPGLFTEKDQVRTWVHLKACWTTQSQNNPRVA